MIELKITVDIPALDRLTAKLDAYLSEKLTAPVAPYTAPDMPVAPAPAAPIAGPTPSVTIPAPGPAPGVRVAAPAPVAPTAAPSYTIAQVARAGAMLLTEKPALQDQLLDLLHRYGAQTAQDIPQDRLGEFAAELRQMGAKI